MELIDYVRMLGRHWAWVLLFTLLGVGAGLVWVTTAPKTYSATSDLFVGNVVPDRPTKSAVESEAASMYVINRMPSYAALISSPDIANKVISDLRLSSSSDEFTRSVTASVPTKTVLIRVSAQSTDAGTAAATANAAAAALGAKIEQLEGAGQGGTSPVSATVVRPASTPTAPSSPNKKLSIALGLLVGLGLGLVAASLREQASRRPSTRGRRHAPAATVDVEAALFTPGDAGSPEFTKR